MEIFVCKILWKHDSSRHGGTRRGGVRQRGSQLCWYVIRIFQIVPQCAVSTGNTLPPPHSPLSPGSWSFALFSVFAAGDSVSVSGECQVIGSVFMWWCWRRKRAAAGLGNFYIYMLLLASNGRTVSRWDLGCMTLYHGGSGPPTPGIMWEHQAGGRRPNGRSKITLPSIFYGSFPWLSGEYVINITQAKTGAINCHLSRVAAATL